MDPHVFHSVRDSYACDQLASVIPKVLNTACPTMWQFTPEHCQSISPRKSTSVIFSLTAWKRHPEHDLDLMNILVRNYKNVFFFPQMKEDYDYMQSFNISGIKVLPSTVHSYDRFLENEDIDFIGTRLHGGIRALQKKHRTLVLAVDVRSTEIGKDTNLAVLRRGDASGIQTWIDNPTPTNIRLPQDAIDAWKQQFALCANIHDQKNLTQNDNLIAPLVSLKKNSVHPSLQHDAKHT